jgi:hypothetical protein
MAPLRYRPVLSPCPQGTVSVQDPFRTRLCVSGITAAHRGGSPSGPGFEIFPWPVNFSYGNCVAASNASGSNHTRLVMEPCDPGNTARVFRLG